MLHAIERRKTKLELARSQTELIESKLAAESANDAKTVFLAMMSHEFRTPLQNLLGFLVSSEENQHSSRHSLSLRRRAQGRLNYEYTQRAWQY